MAITRGRASNSTTQTVADGTWTDILPASYPGCEELVVQCVSASAAPTRVAVQSRNATDSAHTIASNTPSDWAELAAGESMVFAGSIENKITRAMVAGGGGTATLKWSVTKP